MSVEMAIWRMTDTGPKPISFRGLDRESRLEDMIVADPTLTGLDVLVIGRQVTTAFGGFIDVLGVDIDGRLHVLELKRDRTPREVVAQTLDYATWIQDLSLEDVATIYAEHNDGELDEAFAERFGIPLPDVFNSGHELTIVASELDPASERIVAYLAERYGVPINAVFFRHFADGDAEYLARTWLLSPEEAETTRPRTRSAAAKVRPWNGQDFYVILGNTEQREGRWELAARYGFVGAGGGSWYSKPLRNLSPGKRVFAYVGGAGYVGVGEVTGPMLLLREFESSENGSTVRVIDQPEVPDRLRERAMSDDPEVTEYAVPVRWLAQRPVESAVRQPGLFTSQVTVCKLRDERTIEIVSEALRVET